MTRCLITYQSLRSPEQFYSKEGLKLLSSRLASLNPLPFTAQEQLEEAARRATKMSIAGVQPKLSARLSPAKGCFNLVTTHGTFILKPQHPAFQFLPENEDLTMRLAKLVGIEVPLHGLLNCADGSKTYFIKRFDRHGRNKKYAVEDFSQLLGHTRDTKYDSSIEKVVQVIERYATFPLIEKQKLFVRILTCFLLGNEDMHLKNYSLINRKNKYELAPAYDFVNTTIILSNAAEESALPLKGKKRKLTKDDLVSYLGENRLNLNAKVIEEVLVRLRAVRPKRHECISNSLLPPHLQERYHQLIEERAARLGLLEGATL